MSRPSRSESAAAPTTGTAPRRSRLRIEIALALAFKVVVLGLLWFAFFRPDPDHPKPSRETLFSRSAPIVLKENRHDDR